MTGKPPPPRPSRWGLFALLGAGLAVLAFVFVYVLGLAGQADGGADVPSAARTSGGAASAAGSEGQPATVLDADRAALLAVDAAAPTAADSASAANSSTAEAAWTGPTSTFTGIVVDHTGRAIAGARVTCWPDEGTAKALGVAWDVIDPELSPALRTTTDQAGRFELRAPHAAAVAGEPMIDYLNRYPLLVVEASGFAVRSVECLGLDAGDFDAGTIAVEPGGSLTGRVVDEQGRPIAGARVRAQQGRFEPRFVASKDDDWPAYEHIDPAVSDISGEDGRFELGGFWPGTANLHWVSAEGYLATSGNDQIEVSVGATRDLGDLVLMSGGTLSGLVVDEAGLPVAGADVFVQEPPTFDRLKNASDGVLRAIEELRSAGRQPVQTSADGRFSVSALPHGNLEACVDAPGFEPARVSDVTTGSHDVRVSLVRQATLHLAVVGGEPPEPIADARVEAVRCSGRMLGADPSLKVRAGATPGTFVVERVGTFRTDLVVSAAGFATDGFSAPGAKPPETLELTVTLAPESRVTGRVLAMDGQPIADATVSMSGPQAADIRLPSIDATSGRDGRFELTGLVSGERTLRAKAQGYIDDEWPVSVPEAGLLDGIDLQLERGAALFGTYFGSDGQPVRGDEVRLTLLEDGRPTQNVSVQSNLTGDYVAADLKPGQWEVGYREKVPVELLPGQRVRLDLHAPRPARVRGQVLAGGRPRSGSFVIALDETNAQRFGDLLPRATTKADADGRYELALDPGEWIMQAGGYDPPCGGTNRVPLTVTWGEEHIVDLVFSGERLSLLVVDADTGEGLSGADWYLKPRSESDPQTLTFSFGSPGDMIGFWPQTDPAGRAELPFVQPGAYTLNCNRSGYLSQSLPDVEIVAGEPRELRIELQAESVLRGSIRLASGVPVQDATQVSLEAVDATLGEPRKSFTQDGAFRFARVPDGEYRLSIWPPHVATAGEPGATPPLLEQHVTLVAGESKTLDLVLPP